MKKLIIVFLSCLIALSGFLFFSRADEKPKYQYETAICAMFKNEAKWLKEWVVFHHDVVGFEHFYLYNNDSSDNFREVLQPFIASGIVEIIDWTSNDPAHKYDDRSGQCPYPWFPEQLGAFNDCIKNRALGQAKWVAMIDLDEFITPVQGAATLRPFLQMHEKRKTGAINFSWRCFGTSNVADLQPGELLTEKMIHRAVDHHLMNGWVKSMYRPEAVLECHIHEARKLNAGYHKRHAKSTEFRIQHYWTRTEKQCLKRRQLNNSENRAYLDEFNAVEDRTMDQYIVPLKTAMNRF